MAFGLYWYWCRLLSACRKEEECDVPGNLYHHPNYFGDATQRWGYYLIAAATSGGFWTIFGPILMTTLLLRVSGVTLLEKSLKDAKPGYREYIETTSAFIPWFPRKRR